jgi:hypothetical protein
MPVGNLYGHIAAAETVRVAFALPDISSRLLRKWQGGVYVDLLYIGKRRRANGAYIHVSHGL